MVDPHPKQLGARTSVAVVVVFQADERPLTSMAAPDGIARVGIQAPVAAEVPDK